MSAPKPPVVSLHPFRRCVVRAALVRLPAVLMMVPALLMTFGVVASAEQSQPAGELITIESDQQSADNTTGVVTASGNVRLVHADRGVVATGRQAQYFTKEERIVLSGDVDVVEAIYLHFPLSSRLLLSSSLEICVPSSPGVALHPQLDRL